MKLLFSISLIVFLGFQASAGVTVKTNNGVLPDGKLNNQSQSKEKAKQTKYDFSLFKFISPATIQENDTSKTIKKEGDLKDETVYEKPLSFFRFSYAS